MLNAQRLMLNAQRLMLNAQRLMLNAQRLMLNAQRLMLNAQRLMLNAQRLMLNAQRLMLNAQRLMLNAQRLMLNAQRLMLNAQRLMLNAQRLMLNAQRLMLNAQRLMLNAQRLMLNAQRLMLNAQRLMLNAQRLMLNAQRLMLNAQRLMLNAQRLMLNAHCRRCFSYAVSAVLATCFAPPSVTDHQMSESLKEVVTSIVMDQDMVPRISCRTMANLVSELSSLRKHWTQGAQSYLEDKKNALDTMAMMDKVLPKIQMPEVLKTVPSMPNLSAMNPALGKIKEAMQSLQEVAKYVLSSDLVQKWKFSFTGDGEKKEGQPSLRGDGADREDKEEGASPGGGGGDGGKDEGGPSPACNGASGFRIDAVVVGCSEDGGMGVSVSCGRVEGVPEGLAVDTDAGLLGCSEHGEVGVLGRFCLGELGAVDSALGAAAHESLPGEDIRCMEGGGQGGQGGDGGLFAGRENQSMEGGGQGGQGDYGGSAMAVAVGEVCSVAVTGVAKVTDRTQQGCGSGACGLKGGAGNNKGGDDNDKGANVKGGDYNDKGGRAMTRGQSVLFRMESMLLPSMGPDGLERLGAFGLDELEKDDLEKLVALDDLEADGDRGGRTQRYSCGTDELEADGDRGGRTQRYGCGTDELEKLMAVDGSDDLQTDWVRGGRTQQLRYGSGTKKLTALDNADDLQTDGARGGRTQQLRYGCGTKKLMALDGDDDLETVGADHQGAGGEKEAKPKAEEASGCRIAALRKIEMAPPGRLLFFHRAQPDAPDDEAGPSGLAPDSMAPGLGLKRLFCLYEYVSAAHFNTRIVLGPRALKDHRLSTYRRGLHAISQAGTQSGSQVEDNSDDDPGIDGY
eukprot:gene12572-15796_t